MKQRGAHRDRPTYWINVALVLTVLGLLYFYTRIVIGVSAPDPVPAQAPTPGPTVYVEAPSSPKLTPMQLARAIKPLWKLDPGDRVLLWRSDGTKPRSCTFIGWSGDLDFSDVRCKDDGLEMNVHTAYLTPVEALSAPRG